MVREAKSVTKSQESKTVQMPPEEEAFCLDKNGEYIDEEESPDLSITCANNSKSLKKRRLIEQYLELRRLKEQLLDDFDTSYIGIEDELNGDHLP